MPRDGKSHPVIGEAVVSLKYKIADILDRGSFFGEHTVMLGRD